MTVGNVGRIADFFYYAAVASNDRATDLVVCRGIAVAIPDIGRVADLFYRAAVASNDRAVDLVVSRGITVIIPDIGRTADFFRTGRAAAVSRIASGIQGCLGADCASHQYQGYKHHFKSLHIAIPYLLFWGAPHHQS